MAKKTTAVAKRPTSGVVSDRMIEHWISRAVPVLSAPVGFTVLAPGIEVMHHLWGGDPTSTPFYALGVFAAGGGTTVFTWHAAGNRKHLRWLATGTGAAVTVAAGVGMVIGFGPIASVYAFGGLALSALWGVRHVMKWGADGDQAGSGHPLGRLGEVVDAEKFTFRKMRTTGKGVIEGEVVAEVGSTIEEAQALAPVIAAATKVPAGSATIRQDPDDSSKAVFRLAVADLLKTGFPFDPYQGTGDSVTKAFPVAVYEHGDPVQIAVTAQGNGVIEHLIVMGVSGAGKSAYARALVTRLLVRRRVAVIAVDTGKGLQTFGCLAHGLAMLVPEMSMARRLLKQMSVVIKDRTAHLTREGLDYWTEESSLQFLVVWIEEAADLMPSKEAYDEMLRKARSAGIWIISSLQRASHENLSTDARANHGAGACFGVRSMEDAGFVLPDEVIDAGVCPTWKTAKPGYHYLTGLETDPDNWTVKARGYDTRNKAAIAAAVTAAAPIRDQLDQVTTKALGPLWEHRTVHTGPVGVSEADPAPAPETDPRAQAVAANQTPVFSDADMAVMEVVNEVTDALKAAPHLPAEMVLRTALPRAMRAHPAADAAAVLEALNVIAQHVGTNPAATKAAPQAGPASQPAATDPQPTGGGFDMDDEDEDEMDMSAAERAELQGARQDLADALTGARRTYLDDEGLADEHPGVDLDTPLPDTDDIEMDLDTGDPAQAVTPAQARQMFEEQLAAWLAGGKFSFTVKDMDTCGLIERMGASRYWFYRNKNRYFRAGIIASVDGQIGEYDILRSPHDSHHQAA